MEVPPIHYTKSGDVHVAYQLFGRGPIDLVLVPGWASHIEYAWEEPSLARFLEQLGTFARVLWFDKRGTGLSDRVHGVPILEERMDDIRAVMDAAGVRRAAVVGTSEGGSMSVLFAATYPERVSALVLIGAFAKRIRSADYPWAPTVQDRESWIRQLEDGWGGGDELPSLAPSRQADPAFRKWFAAYGRISVSPAAARELATMNSSIDIRPILPSVHVPTLVLHRTGDRDVDLGNARYLATHIPEARFLELPGDDHLFWTGDPDRILEEIREFLTGVRVPRHPDRVLLTVLFTDIVNSTAMASSMGDARWRELLDRHQRAIRRELVRHQGEEVKSTGDGFLATFEGPARAIRCALAISGDVAELGLSVRLGIHTGECERVGSDVAGIAVHIASRVAGVSAGQAVVVTNTVKDLVAGSGIGFRDMGVRALKGLDEPWHLFQASAPPAGGIPVSISSGDSQ